MSGAARRGGAGNALTQGVARIFKFQEDKLNWRKWRSAPHAVTTFKRRRTPQPWGSIVLWRSTSAGRGGSGGEVDAAGVMADIFGNALGNSIVGIRLERAARVTGTAWTRRSHAGRSLGATRFVRA